MPDYFFLLFLSVSLICRSAERRSVWISLNFIPGDAVSQPASDGRTGWKDVHLMSSGMKLAIISRQWSGKRNRDWIRATAWESRHLQLCFPTSGMKIVVCSVSQSGVCSSHSGSLCAESVLASAWCKLIRPNSTHNNFFITLDAWIIFKHCCFYFWSQGELLNINEKCQGWCLTSALWAYFTLKPEGNDFKKKCLFCNFVHCVLVIVNVAV